ncbi:dihydrofolate reductase family protein [Krasilnikoviella flava]|uniref:RibD C-terminal domain-containing protein n=1 Tax=Krasilnikoviella flava TaxID=526729 RepID=A0A1T5JJY3_9MICO|nr:dihydrofolate reductase family protein [Krasilnikoviella flava]SKC51694.1 RibD C-terminal domain-containing protein [Krasilnikoviella flava]
MRLSVTIVTSLDGVVQGPDGPEEDTRGGFAEGGWFVPFTAGTTVVRPADEADLAAEVQALKDGPDGELQVHGSARLASTLHDLGLVDVWRLVVAPVVVGSGARLFDDGAAPSGFAVTRSWLGDTGLVFLELEPRPLRHGAADVVDGAQSVRVD